MAENTRKLLMFGGLTGNETRKKMKKTKYNYEIEPEDMPLFLNELASITKDEETRFKLAQCSAFIFGIIHTFKKRN